MWKGCSWTSLDGDSPSLPSAALVPINIFPPGIFSISSAAGCQEETCVGPNIFNVSVRYGQKIKKTNFLPAAVSKHRAEIHDTTLTAMFDKLTLANINLMLRLFIHL